MLAGSISGAFFNRIYAIVFMIPNPSEVGHIDFGADPVGDDVGVGVGVGIGIGVGMTLPCLHNILWTSGWILTKFPWTYNWDITRNWLDFDGWILTKFPWTYNWDITRNWLDFDGLDLFYKATAIQNWKFTIWEHLFSLKTPIFTPFF